MIEILLNDGTSILDEFKVERVYEWADNLRKNILVHKTYLSITDISKSESETGRNF